MDIPQLERIILGDLWASPDLWKHLVYLCDTCNGRFAGTEDERRAGDYLLASSRKYGLENVTAESFEMRGWERGEACLVVSDGQRPVELPCLALPGTQSCDLQAEIVDVKQGTVTDFERLGTSVGGKIVLTSHDGPSRQEKYQHAVEAGAAAFVFSGGRPGMLAPTGSVEKDLPAIGLSYEHAARLRRLMEAGPQRAHLSIKARVMPVTARNILAEIPGSKPADGWILAGGHYDGHDICQAAQDNAAGIAVLLEAARLLSPLRTHLKAGIRFIFFSGEELGLYGSYAYTQDHADELDKIRLVFNVDVVGAGMPLVLQTQASPELAETLRKLPLLELDATVNDGPGAFIQNSDHFPFSLAGVSGVWAVTSHPPSGGGWVHTAADTLDKLDLRIVRQTASTVARLLLRIAGDPSGLHRGCKSPEAVQKAVTEAGFEKALRFKGKWPF